MSNKTKLLEQLCDLVVKNGHLKPELLSLEVIDFFKELFVNSNALLLCESGLSYKTLHEIYDLLTRWEKEIEDTLGEDEIRSRKNFVFFDFTENQSKTIH